MKLARLLFALLAIGLHSTAQEKKLGLQQLFEVIRNYHPVAKQASINIDKAKAGVVIARGEFDPVLSHYAANKTFDGLDYYQYSHQELSIPTWYGIEIKGGLETLNGNKTDPSATIGNTNYAGISFPILNGLVTDKRRTALQQSKIIQSLSVIEQRQIINDLMLDAAEAYWNWCINYAKMDVVNKGIQNNTNRLSFIKKSWENGERPAIDTLEAFSQLLSFQNKLEQQKYYLLKSALELSAFLWDKNLAPYILPNDIIPENNLNDNLSDKDDLSLTSLLNAIENHPELLILKNKSDFLQAEKKLKFQELLPKLNVEYNFLGKSYDFTKLSGTMFENNYRYGVKFGMPLRISKGRGEYRSAKLKIRENDIKLIQKKQSLTIKIKQQFAQLETLKKQLQLQSINYNNYNRLLEAEQMRFNNGESSLFLINSRENKALEELEKLIETKGKQSIAQYTLRWSAGLLQ